MADSEDQTNLKKRARRRLVGAIALVTFVVIVLPMVFDKEPKPVARDISIQIPNPDSSAFQNKVVPVPPPIAVPAPTPALPPATTAPAPDRAKAAAKPEGKPGAKLAPKAEAKTKTQAAPGSNPVSAVAPTPAEKLATTPEIQSGVVAGTTMPPASATKSPAVPNAKGTSTAKAESPAKENAATGAWVVKLGAFAERDNVTKLQAKLSAAGFKSYTEPMDSGQGPRTRVRAGPFPTRAAAERAQDKLKKMGLAGVVGEK